jgi:predicted DNA-binding protein
MTKQLFVRPTREQQNWLDNYSAKKHKTNSQILKEALDAYIELDKDPVAYIAKRNAKLAEQLRATKDELEKLKMKTELVIQQEQAKQKTQALKEAEQREKAKDRAFKGEGKVDWNGSEGVTVGKDEDGFHDIGDGFFG